MKRLAVLLGVLGVLGFACQAEAGLELGVLPGGEVEWAVHAGSLPNTTDYDWWYGCSPTSVGMMIGHYDRNGYGGNTYNNLVPGGVAEASNYGNPGAWANSVIASAGHISDFYVAGYGASGDDLPPPHHSFNSLADFMGTSQDSVGNSNGGTTFFYYTNGSPITASDIFGYGLADRSGMYGIGEYVTYAGYGYTTLYNQYIEEYGRTYGFGYDQYKAEIDAGRPVLIHISGHSMYGMGYQDGTNTIYVQDTWTPGPHPMTWGGYYSGARHYAVSLLEISGGQQIIPEPASIVVWSLLGGLGLVVGWRRRRRAP